MNSTGPRSVNISETENGKNFISTSPFDMPCFTIDEQNNGASLQFSSTVTSSNLGNNDRFSIDQNAGAFIPAGAFGTNASLCSFSLSQGLSSIGVMTQISNQLTELNGTSTGVVPLTPFGVISSFSASVVTTGQSIIEASGGVCRVRTTATYDWSWEGEVDGNPMSLSGLENCDSLSNPLVKGNCLCFGVSTGVTGSNLDVYTITFNALI